MMKGKMDLWDDEKGYGFIRPDDGPPDVFIHISALKEMSRRPVVGDIIHFTATLYNGKPRAIIASIEGVPSIHKPVPLPPTQKAVKPKDRPTQGGNYAGINNRPRKRSYSTSILMLLLAIAFWAVSYYKTSARPPSHDAVRAPMPNVSITRESNIQEPASQYRCEGKTRCSQMASCEEAKFYLRNCPGVELDGDHDGIPCEQQWCN